MGHWDSLLTEKPDRPGRPPASNPAAGEPGQPFQNNNTSHGLALYRIVLPVEPPGQVSRQVKFERYWISWHWSGSSRAAFRSAGPVLDPKPSGRMAEQNR